ncbi:uncharacterized protein LOC117122504 [Anneissia japonica]|uniref:uncharacterized protein LOC117122504 n=1 Tax=Anneissia japonica TaxID=1529436 RepID=UPI001425744B|nr:uncharacterized protein LOC117122504 [Anneissia japonica]
MGSPLSTVIASTFLEEFEQLALLSATKQLKLWLRYIDDIFIIWQHIYRKPTHTDRYLNKRSFRHPSTKKGVCNTLVRRAHCISDHNSIRKEVQHVKAALKLNGYHTRDIATPRPNPNPNRLDNIESRKSVCLPYLGQLSHRIQRIILQADVKVFHSASNKLSRTLQTHKDKPPAHRQQEFIGSRANVGRFTLVEQDEISALGSRNTKAMSGVGNKKNLL